MASGPSGEGPARPTASVGSSTISTQVSVFEARASRLDRRRSGRPGEIQSVTGVGVDVGEGVGVDVAVGKGVGEARMGIRPPAPQEPTSARDARESKRERQRRMAGPPATYRRTHKEATRARRRSGGGGPAGLGPGGGGRGGVPG